ncbi:hypothetical protein AMS68_000657 [Peltaster fructicola]|uniref:Uncharacterized protein n=1 Tax=Peltaster fructicola TaxID=286661 RepID=A0A6H0XKV7_9PEZI|nr:hypothetical protein AMS68_000657 [Peltaster fructicola]
MTFLRLAGRRAFQPASTAFVSRRAFASATTLRAQNGYGDPKGSPAGENPQEQGRNPQVDKEHPGPPPPSTAGGESSSSSGGSQSSSSAKDGSKPMIHDESQPKNESEDVKRHNEELDQRKEKTHSRDSGEKVDPKFWKGDAGDHKQ